MESFSDLILKRQSCRYYVDTPVAAEDLAACLDAARLAPSARNSQPWKFIVCRGSTKEKLTRCVQGEGMNSFASDAPVLVAVVEQMTPVTVRRRTVEERQKFAQIDIGIAVAHFCLRATEIGLSTCILGWLDEAAIKEMFSLSEEERVRLVLTAGHAAEDPIKPKKRKTLDEIAVFFDD